VKDIGKDCHFIEWLSSQPPFFTTKKRAEEAEHEFFSVLIKGKRITAHKKNNKKKCVLNQQLN
jgi:hypothetical protein